MIRIGNLSLPVDGRPEDLARRAARALGMPLVEMPAPERCSEDFGHYLKRVPGAIFFLGNGEGYPGVHDRRFDFQDAQLEQAVSLFLGILAQP